MKKSRGPERGEMSAIVRIDDGGRTNARRPTKTRDDALGTSDTEKRRGRTRRLRAGNDDDDDYDDYDDYDYDHDHDDHDDHDHDHDHDHAGRRRWQRRGADRERGREARAQFSSRIPVPVARRREPPIRSDRPVQLYPGSRLPVPVRRPEHPSDRTNRPKPVDHPPVRRCTYVLPEPAVVGRGRPTDVRDATTATVGGDGGGGGGGGPAGHFTFAVNATINVECRGFACGHRYAADRGSGAVQDYLDNHMDVAMVAPRALAVPGCPYVRIDEDDDVPTPEHWRQMLADRSSFGSPVPPDLGDDSRDAYHRLADDVPSYSTRRSRASSADRECARPNGARARCKSSYDQRRSR